MPGFWNRIQKNRAHIIIICITIIGILPIPITAYNLVGSVNDSLKNPLGNVTIELYDFESGNLLSSGQSNAAGSILFSALDEMYYQIRLSIAPYPDQWFSSSGNTKYRQYRMYIGAASTVDTLHITPLLNPVDNTPNNTLIITLADSMGKTLSNDNDISVSLLRNFDGYAFPEKYSSGSTTVTFDSLQPAHYAICLTGPSLTRQYYHPDRNTTWPLYYQPVSGGSRITQTVRSYDPPRGEAFLYGKCISESDAALGGVNVSLCQPYDTFSVRYTWTTDASGYFSFTEIIDADYFLKLSGTNYPVQWFSKTRSATTRYPDDYLWPNPTTDTLIIRLSPDPINNSPTGSVQLSIKDSSGSPIVEQGNIYFLRSNDTTVFTPHFDSLSGYYVMGNLPSGYYYIKLDFPSFPIQYYTPVVNITNPLYYVTITAENTLVFDVTLSKNPQTISTTFPDGYICGMVHDSTGTLANAIVTFFNYSSGARIASVVTNNDGTFDALALPPQPLYVQIEFSAYPILYWSTQGMTTQLSYVNYCYNAPYDTLTIDADLSSTGSSTVQASGIGTVRGKVTDQSTGSPVAGAHIMLFNYDPGTIYNARYLWSPWMSSTDSTGSFIISNIPFGNYCCIAEAESLNYVLQFFPKSDAYITAKTMIIDSSATSFTLDFSLRKGAEMVGRVLDENSNPLPDVQIHCSNSENTHYFEGTTSDDGTWRLSGFPKGTWNVWVNHDRYILFNDTLKRTYLLTEGTVTGIPDFQLSMAGFAQGTFTAPFSLFDASSSGYTLHEGELSSFPLPENAHSTVLWPEFSTGLFFESLSSDGTSGKFMSYATKPGTFGLIFSPRAVSYEQGSTPSAQQIIPGLGYSFITTAASPVSPATYTIPSGDTARGIFISLRKGYSVFANLKNETGLLLTANCGIDVFVKIDTLFYLIAHSTLLSNGLFEIPGLVDNEDYYLHVWADGYPGQFWAADGNTVTPSQPYHFDTETYTSLQLTIIPSPKGLKPEMTPGPISLWIDGDSLGAPLLKWKNTAGLSIDNYTIYRSDRGGTLSSIATVPATTTADVYSLRPQQTDVGFRRYIVTGKSSTIHVKSNSIDFDSRNTVSTGSASLWLDVSPNRWLIQLEWGSEKGVTLSETDSVHFFRRSGDETARLLFTSGIWNTMMDDHSWKQSDSGKTFIYHVEIPGKGLISPEVSITLGASFFAQIPSVYSVGPYEKYQRISDAVAAAADGDHIEIQPGTYRENISFAGKNLSINGTWTYGNPPEIDGGGSVAITIPYVSSVNEWYRPRISGLSIINSSVGIKSYCTIETEACLFDNVGIAVAMMIDSSAMVRSTNENPFIPSMIEGQLKHCTFIAQKSGNTIAALSARGIAEQTGYTGQYTGRERFYLSPAVSFSSMVTIDLSNIVFYESRGFQTKLPVTIQGNTCRTEFYRSNFWKTSTTVNESNVQLADNCTSLDPQFSDSAFWFVADTSPLAGTTYETRIGYDVHLLDSYDGSDANRPASVKNISATTVGLSAVLIRWSASSVSENIVHYRLYRIPGNPELFYINQNAKWDVKMSEDSLFSIIDSFSTENTAFLDTTVQIGTPYLYVVAAVNSDGIEGEIDLPAPPDISTYFVNKAPDRITLAADKWHMVGGIGTANIVLDENTTHSLFGWNDKNTADKLYAQYYRSSSLLPTSGYWIKPSKDTTLSVNQSSVTSLKEIESTVSISLKKGGTGWNLVASPFPFAVKPSWIDTYTSWEWNADSIGYRKATTLRPWTAYWIHTERDTQLTVWKKQDLSSYLAATLAKSAAKPLQWRLQLSLRSGNSYDIDNYIGTLTSRLGKAAAMKSLEPPKAFDGAQLYLLDNDTAQPASSGRFAELYKVTASGTDKLEWVVGIGTSEQPSILHIGPLTSLPDALYAFWVEKNRVIDLRKQNEITFPAQSTDQFGLIVITANTADLALYTGQLLLRTPFPNPCRSTATIEYTIPYLWAENGILASGETSPVSLTLYDIQGREVLLIVNEHRKPGVYRTVWNGKRSNGQPVAAGMYFMKLQCGKNSTLNRFCRIR